MKFSNENNFIRSQYFCAQCVRLGVFLHPHHNWFLSAAHQEKDIQETLQRIEPAFALTKEKFGE